MISHCERGLIWLNSEKKKNMYVSYSLGIKNGSSKCTWILEITGQQNSTSQLFSRKLTVGVLRRNLVVIAENTIATKMNFLIQEFTSLPKYKDKFYLSWCKRIFIISILVIYNKLSFMIRYSCGLSNIYSCIILNLNNREKVRRNSILRGMKRMLLAMKFKRILY